MDINGKVFIVTGGASGLGEGTARMLAAKGAKVVIADMQADKGEAVAKELGGRSSFSQALAIAASLESVSMIGVPSAASNANSFSPGWMAGACGNRRATSSESMGLT